MADAETETGAAETNHALDTRYPAAAVPAITGMRLSPGDTVTLLNISASGALVEGTARLVPSTRVTVHFEGTITPRQITARVVRCMVSAIGSGGALQYHSGIAFDRPLSLPLGEAVAPRVTVPPIEEARAATGSQTAVAPAPVPGPRIYNRW